MDSSLRAQPSDPYEELIGGIPLLRVPPGPRHELLCRRLHAAVTAVTSASHLSRLLDPRSAVRLDASNVVRPDLAVVTSATGRLWLAAEVISADDHHADTVVKKALYEDLRIARLWMIDPRYDNVEVYHGTVHGLVLQRMLASREVLAEPLLPGLGIGVGPLFAA